MLIDCTTCVARDIACHDCVISVLLSTPPPGHADEPEFEVDHGADGGVELDETARYALGNLADAGLVPPLRLVAAVSERTGRAGRGGREIA